MGMSVPGNSCRNNTALIPSNGGCLVRVPGKCVYYTGTSIPTADINTGEDLDSVIAKLANDVSGAVTSVGLSMPAAFSVANSPITSSGTLAVTAVGTAAQFITGTGTLGTATNGLTLSGGSLRWGGSLIQSTTISGGSVNNLTFSAVNTFSVIQTLGTSMSLNSLGLDLGSARLNFITSSGAFALSNATAGNFGVIEMRPSTGTDVSAGIYLIPRGAGFNASIKSQYTLFNTDARADPGNTEYCVFRAAGTAYHIGSAQNGSGVTRPIVIGAGLGDTITNDNQFVVHPSGNIGIHTLTPHTSALLELSSTTQGLLFSRMTSTQRDAISATAGLTVYNTTSSKLNFYNGSIWEELSTGGGGGGTVTSFTFTDGSGFDGTVSTGTTTPTLSLTTSLNTNSVPFIGAAGALSQNTFFTFTNATQSLVVGGRFIVNPTGQDYAAVSGAPETGPGMYVRRQITNDGVNANEHGFIDGTTFARATKAYAAFDAQPVMTGVSNYDHLASFQARPEFSGSGIITNVYNVSSMPAVTGTATISNLYHLVVYPPGISAPNTGTIVNSYGLFVGALSGTNKYAIYTEADPSYFGGNIQMGPNGAVYPITINKDGVPLVGNWVNVMQVADSSGSGGVNIGYDSSSLDGIFAAQGATNGFQFWTHNGTSFAQRMRIAPVGTINFSNVQEFADNAAALGGGLIVGDLYRTGDNLKIVH